MDFSYIHNYRFFVSLGYVTILASILTLLVTQIIKLILKKKKVIYESMEESKKDMILSRTGRIVALIIYAGLYIGNEIYFKQEIKINEELITGLLTGATLTLTIAKGIFTMLHQWAKKENVFERLEYVEQINKELNVEKTSKEQEEKIVKKKWTLTNKK